MKKWIKQALEMIERETQCTVVDIQLGSHHRLTLERGTKRFSVHISGTPSDRRGIHNKIAEIRRLSRS